MGFASASLDCRHGDICVAGRGSFIHRGQLIRSAGDLAQIYSSVECSIQHDDFVSQGWVLGAACPDCGGFAPATPVTGFVDCGTYEKAGWHWEVDCPCGSHFLSENTRLRLWTSFSCEEAARIFHVLSPIMCARMD